jgi:hypothetical protein
VIRRRGARIAGLLAAAAVASCASPAPIDDPRYRPAESVLEVAATLRLHVDDDTYRRRPARDFTGKNIFRAAFARFEQLELQYSSKFRSGYLQDAIWFGMARSAERIASYDLAAKLYTKVTQLDSELAAPARDGQRFCVRLHTIAQMRPSPDLPADRALRVFDDRSAKLEALLTEASESHFAFIVREEQERNDRARAHYAGARRRVDPSFDTVALQAHQALVQNHPESKNRNRNLLELARFYEDLARDYERECPAISLCFDPATFDEYTFGATRVYESVAQQDGAIEKIEAARRLEALLAFILQVYDEKLPSTSAG